MKILLSLLAVAGLLFVGCGSKAKSKQADTNAPIAEGNPLTAPADYLGAMGRAKKLAERTVDLNAINQAIQLFYAQEDRFPKNLKELVDGHYLPQIPEAPAGTRFVYNPQTGQLGTTREASPPPAR
jgi:hypothetical protein